MRYNIFRSLLFSIRAFGLWRGLHLPVYVCAPVRVVNMGRIEVDGPLRRGMIILGMNSNDTTAPCSIWDNRGTVRVHGRMWLHHGCRLHNEGTVEFGRGVIISHNCVLDIYERLTFGDNVSVGYGSEFMDTDIHFMVDVASRQVRRNTAPIRIGDFNWLGSHTYVKKGSVTPRGIIVASPNGVLLRDYTSDVPPYSILGGQPARIIGQGKRRVLNHQHEMELRRALHVDECVTLPDTLDLDEYCALKGLE